MQSRGLDIGRSHGGAGGIRSSSLQEGTQLVLQPVATERWHDDAIIVATAASLPAQSTVLLYRRDVERFVSELYDIAGKSPVDATIDDLLSWWNWLRSHLNISGVGFKPATVNRRVMAVRRFYREGTRRDYFTKDLSSVLPTLRTSKEPQGRALTREEVQKLLWSCQQAPSLLGFRNHVVVAFLLSVGCRVSELCNVRIEDMERSGGHVLVRLVRKGNKETREVVPSHLSVLIDAWRQRAQISDGHLVRGIMVLSGGQETVRPGRVDRKTVFRIVTECAERAGIGKDVGPHDLRRTYITTVNSLEPNVFKTARAAGHESIETTNRYVHQADYYDDNPNDKMAAWLWGQQ